MKKILLAATFAVVISAATVLATAQHAQHEHGGGARAKERKGNLPRRARTSINLQPEKTPTPVTQPIQTRMETIMQRPT